jgi:hypothetical protein
MVGIRLCVCAYTAGERVHIAVIFKNPRRYVDSLKAEFCCTTTITTTRTRVRFLNPDPAARAAAAAAAAYTDTDTFPHPWIAGSSIGEYKVSSGLKDKERGTRSGIGCLDGVFLQTVLDALVGTSQILDGIRHSSPLRYALFALRMC